MEFVYVGGSKVAPSGVKHKSVGLEINEDNPFQTDLTGAAKVTVHKKTDYNTQIIRQTKNALISIIGGLSQTNFDHSTLNVAINNIRGYKEAYVDTVGGSKVFVDSGGYSIIVGDVNPADIGRFMYYYNYYLETERDVFDFMFSLDIPVFLGYPQYNTYDYIYKFNKQSLEQSKEMLVKHPELCDKFYFINQFKMPGQYDIWTKLYKELELKKYVKNYAIGGLVGLRGILRNDPNCTDISFSPFTAIAYRSFFDYIHSDSVDNDFRLHTLGIYIKYDRFQLTLLELLFQRYRVELSGENSCAQQMILTYDSVNYMRTAQLKVRDLLIYQFDKGNLITHSNIQTLPDDILRDIYNDEYDDMMIDMANLKAGNMLNNIDTFTAANVYSHKNLDRFFEFIINKYDLINEFFNATDWETLSKKLTVILLTMKANDPTIFNAKMVKCITENLRLTYIFHYWYQNDRSEEKLDESVKAFITKIGFPFGLE